MQFPLAHPSVCSVLSGPITADEACDSLSSYTRTIPAALWQELRAEGLIAEDAPTPDGSAAHEPAKEAS
jgi:D-threo-aldose 1-dehydrogenase